jgi:lysine 2,3-aminomutase
MKDDLLVNEEVEPPGSAALEEVPARPRGGARARRRYSRRSRIFHKRFYPKATLADWHDWRWQLRARILACDELARLLWLSPSERQAIAAHRRPLPLSITPYYASLLDPQDAAHPLRRTVVPVMDEHRSAPGEADDPLGEDQHSPVPGLVHRYPDRVLFMVTDFCSTHCRYCTRSRMVGDGSGMRFHREQWERCLGYIEGERGVRDVLISGGDPLTLPDEVLEWLLRRLRHIRHVEFVRIGTKVPVVLPQRITRGLVSMLRRYHPLWMSIHFTHPEELTPEVSEACERLADTGIPLGSQTVLLAGINDDLECMRQLLHGLLKIRVRPYYLYQCDPVVGTSHFRTTVSKGLEIIRGLRGFTTGYAVPTYVIDAPGGGGKIPLLPQYVEACDSGGLLLRNFEGRLFRYHDRTVGGPLPGRCP